MTVAHLAEFAPGDLSVWVPLGFRSCKKTFTIHIKNNQIFLTFHTFLSSLDSSPFALVPTEQLVGQHVELLLVQASLRDGGELPAQDLRQLRPLRRRRGEEELQILRKRRGGDLMKN